MFLAANSILKCGIPDRFTTGFWNNVSQCCGNAGVAEYFLFLYQRFHTKEYLTFARDVLDNLTESGTADKNKMYWLQAENRNHRMKFLRKPGLCRELPE